MANLISFSWEKDRDGYELLEFDPTGIEWTLDDRGLNLSTDGDPKMKYTPTPDASPSTLKLLKKYGQWFYSPPDISPETPYIVLDPVGEETIRYRPLNEHPAIFMEMEDVSLNPEGVKSFLDRFGPLFKILPAPHDPRIWYPEIQSLKRAVQAWEAGQKAGSLRNWVKAFNRRDGWRQARSSAKVQLVNTDDPLCPNLEIVPDNLISAIWLQFAQHVSSSTGLQQCNWCSTWFVFGTGTGRRKSAHYCSDRCRQAAHRHGKEKSK